MSEEKKGKEVDIMSTIKPIQATPELRGKDAEKVFSQVNREPSKEAVRKNNMLHGVLANILKA